MRADAPQSVSNRLRLVGSAVLALLVAGTAAAAESNAWSRVAGPTAGPALAIGSTADGCLAGAAALPLDGPGYAVIRPSRRRYFGHPELVDFIAGIGRQARESDLPTIQVGDMAQPRGGPLPFGHASHQTGLDVDLWFTFAARPAPVEREHPDLPSMLLPGGQSIDPARFGPRQVTLLKLAAADPRVDRVFVNPTIKLALCRGFGGARADDPWLRLLRPWWGHDDHFHVRLRCPDGSPDCDPQAPIPPGSGCDAALEDWSRHQAPPKPGKPGAPRPMPAVCMALLVQ